MKFILLPVISTIFLIANTNSEHVDLTIINMEVVAVNVKNNLNVPCIGEVLSLLGLAILHSHYTNPFTSYFQDVRRKRIPFTTGYSCYGIFEDRTDYCQFSGSAIYERIAGGKIIHLNGEFKLVKGRNTCKKIKDDSRIPPYTFSVVADMLALLLLYLVPTVHSGVSSTCLTTVAASSLLTFVIVVTTGPRLEHLLRLAVSAVIAVTIIVSEAWRKRHGTTLSLGIVFDVFSFVFGELSSVEDLSVRGVTERLRNIKETLWGQQYGGLGNNNRATEIGHERRVSGMYPVVLALSLLVIVLMDNISFYHLVTLLGGGAVVSLVAAQRQRRRTYEGRSPLVSVEGPDVLEATSLADLVTERHRNTKEKRCGSDLRDACAEESTNIDNFNNLFGPNDFADIFCDIIKGGRCLIDTAVEVPGGPCGSAEHEKAALGVDDVPITQCYYDMLGPRRRRHEDYTVDEELKKGLSVTEEKDFGPSF